MSMVAHFLAAFSSFDLTRTISAIIAMPSRHPTMTPMINVLRMFSCFADANPQIFGVRYWDVSTAVDTIAMTANAKSLNVTVGMSPEFRDAYCSLIRLENKNAKLDDRYAANPIILMAG